LGNLGLEHFCRWLHNWGRFRVLWMTSKEPGPRNQRQFLFLLFMKKVDDHPHL